MIVWRARCNLLPLMRAALVRRWWQSLHAAVRWLEARIARRTATLAREKLALPEDQNI
jgi:hypothetical protein